MNNDFYPLKFNPIFKEKIWGGNRLKTYLKKDFSPLEKAGESWELSAVKDNVSTIRNGKYQGVSLQKLINTYKGELLGKSIYERFGNEFPLLIKFIDANQDLSIQVHPDNALAKERHNSKGKTEMWYVIKADKEAKLISGFIEEVDKEKYLRYLSENRIEEILNIEEVETGDAFFIPAGRVHAIGAGTLLAEIQQTSDITYRIYDYDRLGADGKKRELHTDLALDAIDFTVQDNYKSSYNTDLDKPNEIVSCKYFTTNYLELERRITKDLSNLDSFVIYICIGGEGSMVYNENSIESFKFGDTILIPNKIENLTISPGPLATLLEVYIE